MRLRGGGRNAKGQRRDTESMTNIKYPEKH